MRSHNQANKIASGRPTARDPTVNSIVLRKIGSVAGTGQNSGVIGQRDDRRLEGQLVFGALDAGVEQHEQRHEHEIRDDAMVKPRVRAERISSETMTNLSDVPAMAEGVTLESKIDGAGSVGAAYLALVSVCAAKNLGACRSCAKPQRRRTRQAE